MRFRLFPLILLSLSLLTSSALAEWIPVNDEGPDNDGARLVSDRGSSIIVSFGLNGYESERVTIEGEEYVRVSAPGMAPTLTEGEPELPIWAKSVIIDDQGDVSVRIISETWDETPSVPVLPSKGNLYRNVDPATVPYQFGDSYSRDVWWPSSSVSLSDPFILRDYRGVTIVVNPVQYNGAKGMLRVCRELRVEVMVSGSGGINPKTRARLGLSHEFMPMYEGRFLNLDERGNEISEQAGRMLVIAASQFYDDMADFVDWKIEKGIDTRLVKYPDETGGSGTTAIKSFIQGEYDGPGVTFVLLVGDKEHVPTLSFAGGEADPMYTLLEGGDVYPDAFVSRFSVRNSEDVQTMVTRSVDYERLPTAESSWYHKATGVASNEGSPADFQWMNEFRDKLLAYNYTEMDQIYAPGASSSQVSNALNTGRGLVLYMGHGSTTAWSTTGFSVSHINSLTNDWKLPLVSCVACVNGNFSSTTCFGEAWLRATHNGQPSGAIASYASSISQSWVPPQYGQQGLVDSLVSDRYNSIGGVLFMGSVAMLEHYGGGYAAQEIFNTWIIFGDCSVQLRTDVPTELTVSHPASILPGTEEITISVPGEADALVAVSKDGVFFGSGYTDAAGNVTVTFDQPMSPDGVAELVVTSYNHIPYAATLPIGEGDPAPPTAPANLSLTADGTLSWSPSTDNIGVEHYVIYRSKDPHFDVDGRRPLGTTSSTSFQVPGSIGNPGMNYYFRVVAKDASGNESTQSLPVGEFDFQMTSGRYLHP